ncbi:hypothetical protein D8B26_005343 [Coccidioides posadasii str. Silveira]|uniref:uncharacterized protein n=1 Tax=Coccidioides posadasii (strain RMSCC 757 / Silveira) TaxID=443226 RepID=UPI001BEFCF84|nr:hypothetical protein D8B26_005343 [Coccidioides posadasii str. Silveira]
MEDRLRAQFTRSVCFDDFDNTETKRHVLRGTELKYTKTLKVFDLFREMHPGAPSPPDVQTFKAFMKFVATNTAGRVHETVLPDSLDGWRRDFETAFQRNRNYKFPQSVSRTMKEFIHKGLGLKEGEMERANTSPNDIATLLLQLWCKDFKEYRGTTRDRSRVQMAAAILMYCFTSARTGEIHESTARRGTARRKIDGSNVDDEEQAAQVLAACYKHFILTVERVDGKAMLVLTYQREFVKNYWRKKSWELPVHAFYEIYTESTALLFNPILYFLSMASGDNAFRDFAAVDELMDAVEQLAAKPKQEDTLFTIHFKEHIKGTPVFRQYGDLTLSKAPAKSRGADAFGKEFADLGRRSNYTCNLTPRGCRRWLLMEADTRYSESARMKLASHTDRDRFQKSYTHPLCEVDGQATFLGIKQHRNEHIKTRRSAAIYKQPALWHSLPAKEEIEFYHRADIIALGRDIEELDDRIAETKEEDNRHSLHKKKRRLLNKRQALYTVALREFQKDQPQKFGHEKVDSLGTSEYTFFSYARRVMPERDLLAQILPMKVELRSPEGRQALRAMEALCKQECEIAYRTSLKPIDGHCICGQAMNKYDVPRGKL